MQRKASARWQGTTQEGSGTLSVQSGTLQRDAVFVQGALRRRQGNQSRGAHRRRPCRLLHDGAVVHAQQCGLHRDGDRHRGAADDGSRSTASRRSRRSTSPTRAQVPDIAAAQFAEIASSAKVNCVVSRALSPGITVTHGRVAGRPDRRGTHDGRSRRPRRKAAGATFNPGESLPPRQRRGVRRRLGAAAERRRRTTTTPRRRSRRRARSSPRARSSRRNDSPDIPFTQSINPYQGCEHGCIYCYARPTHAYLDLSPGLDFETKLFAKPNAAALLRAELAKPGYVCDPIALGTNTDPYQPIEREWKITRSIIEVLAECDHPLTIIDQVRAGRARPRPPRADGREGHRRGSSCRSRRSTASSRASSSRAPRRRTAACRSIKALSDAGVPVGVQRRAGDSAAQRPRPRGDPRGGGGARRAARRLDRCCGCRSRSRRSSAPGSTRTTRCAPRT